MAGNGENGENGEDGEDGENGEDGEDGNGGKAAAHGTGGVAERDGGQRGGRDCAGDSDGIAVYRTIVPWGDGGEHL